MTDTADPRTTALSAMAHPPHNETAESHCTPWGEAEEKLNTYRAAVVRDVLWRLEQSAGDAAAKTRRQSGAGRAGPGRGRGGRPVTGFLDGDLPRRDDRDRDQLYDVAALIERRWPGVYSATCREAGPRRHDQRRVGGVSGVEDLARWIGEQLDAEERIARAAADYDDGATHDVQGPPGTWTCLDESEWFGPSYRGGVIAPRIGTVNAAALGAHIAAHDPAQVLREVDAKRRIVAAYLPPGGDPHPGLPCVNFEEQPPEEYSGHDSCSRHLKASERLLHHDYVLRLLAAVYADRDGYQEAWRP